MLKLSRPTKPDTFDADTRAAKRNVCLAVQNGKKPSFNDDAWPKASAKDCFIDQQHGRCAYCERRLSDTGQLRRLGTAIDLSAGAAW